MKSQALFSLKNKKKKIKMSSAAVVIGALRVNTNEAHEKRTLTLGKIFS